MRQHHQQQRSPRPLFALFSCLGILFGLFARELVESARQELPTADRTVLAAPAAAEPPVATLGIEIRAVLELPTATPLPPTATPKVAATPTPTPADYCGALGAPAIGTVCRMPPPTPLPSPTMVACFSPQARGNQLCEIRPTPAGGWPPTATPIPAPYDGY